jgi:hypothetical protein
MASIPFGECRRDNSWETTSFVAAVTASGGANQPCSAVTLTHPDHTPDKRHKLVAGHPVVPSK